MPFAMEPVVYDFAINERGTQADLLRGDAALHAGRLLHADGAGAAAHRTATTHRRSGAPNWTASAPPAAPSRPWPAWCRPVRPPAAARHEAGTPGARDSLDSAARALRLRPRPARADPSRPAQRAASAWRRTVCRRAARSRTCAPGDVLDRRAAGESAGQRGLPGVGALGAGKRRRGLAGRRRRAAAGPRAPAWSRR